MHWLRWCVFLLLGASPAFAQIGGDGADGDLRPTQDLVLDTSSRAGGWNFGAIVIPAGVTVRLCGSNPAILRAQREVRIDGVLSADGEPAQGSVAGAGGPGGFAGGDGGSPAGQNGHGPGHGLGGAALFGAVGAGEPAAHATPGQGLASLNPRIYGSARPYDPRGGSGAGGTGYPVSWRQAGPGGAGGGGVVTVVADGPIAVTGVITARSPGFGSGGSILLRSLTSLDLAGTVTAAGTVSTPLPLMWSGDGYVRLDAWGRAPVVTGTVAPTPLALELPALSERQSPRIGQVWPLQAATFPGDQVGFFFALAPASLMWPPFGTLGLDPASLTFLGSAVGAPDAYASEAELDIRVPNLQSLVGAPLWVQSLALGSPGPGPRLSNTLATTIQ